MSATENRLTPRAYAVVLILRRVREIRRRIADYEEERDELPDPLFASQIRVALEQTIVELLRAARYLTTTDMSEEDPG